METKILTQTEEILENQQVLNHEYDVHDIAELMKKRDTDTFEAAINEKRPIGRQGDVLYVSHMSKHFINPENFNLELKEENTNILQKSTLNGNDHALKSPNSNHKVYTSKGINQHEAYSKMGLSVSDWMKSTTVGNMYVELNEDTLLMHCEHGNTILPCKKDENGCYTKTWAEVRIQNCVDISHQIRKQID